MRRIRQNIVISNLIITALALVFFSAAPLLGFPAEWDESFGIAQTIGPVFLGNIGFAAAFAAQEPGLQGNRIDKDRLQLISILAYGSILIFILVAAVAVTVFWVSNRPGVMRPGGGMSLQTLQAIVTAALGVNAAVSNHILVRIFPTAKGD
jgi:hypothetical protein